MENWQNKKIMIVGMARSGIALARLLCLQGSLVTINDQKMESAFGDQLQVLDGLAIQRRLGEDGMDALKGQDLLIISPGVPINAPIVLAAREQNIPVSGELEIASRLLRGGMVAVTGTNGKTTTVTLLGEIFKLWGKKGVTAGNIGYPLSAAAYDSQESDVTVVEVSSFQLETTTTFHPSAAAVLNITEDHLNRHGTMEVYAGLKRHIFDTQTSEDFAILNYEDAACKAMAEHVPSRVLYFSRLHEVENGSFVRNGKLMFRLDGTEQEICDANELQIPGPHNLENALAAVAIACSQKVPANVIRQTLQTFQGVEHRIEFVRELESIRYINDSKGTNVDSTQKAIESMTRPTVLILGGYDKHVSFKPLADEIMRYPVIRHCVLIGATAGKIQAALEEAGYQAIHRAGTLEEAVDMSRSLAEKDGNVLFSPACASFDMFSDFEQRGRIFKEIVHRLK